MAVTREQIRSILGDHMVAEGVTVDSDSTEGYLECECGWEADLWRVEGECRCPLDLAADGHETDCTCEFGRLVTNTEEAHAEAGIQLANRHTADELVPVMGIHISRVLDLLGSHLLSVVDDRDSTGQWRAAECSCGFAQTLWRVGGACTCTPRSSSPCEFEQRLLRAVKAGDSATSLLDHLATELSQPAP